MFADSTRIKILYDLFQGEKNVTQICNDLEMNQSAVSHQLKILRSSKLIKARRDGKMMLYSLADEQDKRMKKKFKCEIDCANCAAAVEDAVKKIDGVIDAKVNFMMQKFTLEAEDDRFDAILEEAVKVGKKIEPDFAVEV